MYRVNDTLTKFRGLVGWRQHYDTEEIGLSADLTKSESGLYYQDVHPMLTIENLMSIAPDFSKREYEVWKNNEEYGVGKIVKLRRVTPSNINEDYGMEFGYALYKCIETNQGNNPETSPTYWKHINLFGDWLRHKTDASIIRTLAKFVTNKAILNNAKSVLEHKYLFNQAGRVTDVIRNTDSLVGMEIIPSRYDGVTLKMDKVGLQFNMNGAVKLYLFHSSQVIPLETYELQYTKNGGLQWFDLEDVFLPYVSEDNEAGGSWYLVYDQKALPQGMKAINKTRDWSKAPCRSCSESEHLSWESWSQYMEVHPFKVNAMPTALWDISSNMYTYTNNYGLNLQVSAMCDITDLMIEQRGIFADVVAKQTAYDLLREMAYNPQFRINRTQQNLSTNDILYELDGDSTSNKKSGLGYELEQMYKALDINTDGLSKVCLPCKSIGIRYRSI